jgi:hypothetical protein
MIFDYDPNGTLTPSKAATPSIVPATAEFNDTVKVTISTTTENAQIRYTVDGTDPSESSTLYQTPIVLRATTTVKARAFKDGMSASEIAQRVFTKQTVESPVFSPDGGTFTDSVSVTLSAPDAGALIHYTIDGSEPAAASPQYSAPILLKQTQTVKAIALIDSRKSPVSSALFTVHYSTPSMKLLTPNGGETFRIGDTMNITWETIPGRTVWIMMELSVDGGKTWLLLDIGGHDGIKPDYSNWGNVRWVIPESLPRGEGEVSLISRNARLRLRSYFDQSETDVSDGSFAIIASGAPSAIEQGNRRSRRDAVVIGASDYVRFQDISEYGLTVHRADGSVLYGKRALKAGTRNSVRDIRPGIYFVVVRPDQKFVCRRFAITR